MEIIITNLINDNKWNLAFNTLNKKNKLFDNILNDKNLFHLACIRGHYKTIKKYLQLNSEKMYISDDEGRNGIHLLALNGWDKLLIKILNKYPIFCKMKDNNDNFICNMVINRYSILIKIINIMNINKMTKYYNYVNVMGKNLILYIIDEINNYESKYMYIFMNFINSSKIDWQIPKNNPPFIYIIQNDKLFLINTILEYYNKNNNIKNFSIDVLNSSRQTPLIVALWNKNIEAIKLLINNNADVNFGGIENNNIPIIIALKNNLLEIVELLINNKNINFNIKDKYLNCPLNYLIIHYKSDAENKISKSSMELAILATDLFSANLYGITPLHLLASYKMWTEFADILKNKKIDINIIDKYKRTPLSITNNEDLPEFIDFLEICRKNDNPLTIKKKLKYDLILPHINNSDINFGLFNSDTFHSFIYQIYIIQSYPNISSPVQYPILDKIIWENKNNNLQLINDESLYQLFNWVLNSSKYFFTFLPSIIFWHNKYINYFYPNTKMYIMREIEKKHIRFVLLKITIFIDTSLHANNIIYDKHKNTLCRFEPYGDWTFYDSYFLDEKIKKLFIDVLGKKSKNLKFLRPGDYLKQTKFQSVSLESDSYNKRLGDPKGYCVAWCYWFLELKLKNPDIDEKYLVESTLEKIILNSDISDTSPILTYIRKYAYNLNEQKNKIFQEIGINYNKIYQINRDEETSIKIANYINNFGISIIMNTNHK
jgi:hypothetical protein